MSSNAGEVISNVGKFEDDTIQNISKRLELAGAFLEGKMVDKITSGLSPALHPATIEAKGSSTPLIDTGEMLDQVSHEMEGDLTVKVGVFGSRAGVAAIHEYGAPGANIPERSFERSTFSEQKENVVRIVKGL